MVMSFHRRMNCFNVINIVSVWVCLASHRKWCIYFHFLTFKAVIPPLKCFKEPFALKIYPLIFRRCLRPFDTGGR